MALHVRPTLVDAILATTYVGVRDDRCEEPGARDAMDS